MTAITLDTDSYDALYVQVTARYGFYCGHVICYVLGNTTFTYGENQVRYDIVSTVDHYSSLSELLSNLQHGRDAWQGA